MKSVNLIKKAFTLIELLVVIAIIGLLMSIIMPSLQTAREQSRQAVCAANLHSIGQGIVIYAHDNDDCLAPGNFSISWMTWGSMACGYSEVNLGYLMKSNSLPMPENQKSVFFCPSMLPSVTRQTSGEVYFDYETFENCRQSGRYPAPVDYMYNTSLDGFGNSIVTGMWGILSHKDRLQYLLADGSVHGFKVVPLVYDPAVGPERPQEVCQRYGINFPTKLLHQWFARGEINLNEAQSYLANPSAWMNANADSLVEETARLTRLSQVANASLVSDVMGAWEGTASVTPPSPG